MRKLFDPLWRIRISSVGLAVAMWAIIGSCPAQVRGVYPLGMSATNPGVTPEAGFTYSNQFLFYSRSELKDANGKVTATGQNSVIMDMNSFIWVSKSRIPALGGAIYSCIATLPIANNSLTSDAEGPISGGGGFADSYYQPVVLGWRKERANIRLHYGFLAPTGRYDSNSNNNVGSGYWTNTISSGQTFYLSSNKTTAVSAFELYEFHTVQNGTGIHPGETLNLDYSVTRTLPLNRNVQLQIGLVGYEQWQTTDKTGPTITPAQGAAHYRVNSVGFAANTVLPARKVSLGF
ncbi:MAG: transporter, partial [Verrucomicrobia bacterium]|nr:transporter [Verrucomicrobiota bacterium]